MIGVDFFCGAGGLSAGATSAGVRVAFAVESDPNAATTYRTNHPDVELRQLDIRRMPDLPPLATTQPTVVFGGPPCQGFSTSNQRSRHIHNPENYLYTHFLRHVRSMRPTFVVFENVKGFVETRGGFFFSAVLTQLRELGYSVSHAVLNAADFGVPQRRSRLFIVASRENTPRLPAPLCDKHTTVADAMYDLPSLSNGAAGTNTPYRTPPRSEYARRLRGDCQMCTNNSITRNANYVVERYKYIPQGGNWRDIPAHLMTNYTDRNRCHEGVYHRLRWNAPSIVIGNYRKNMLIHPSENRGLSVREAARIQSFPDSYAFTGSIGFQQQQVANAVPPMLAQAVFQHLH